MTNENFVVISCTSAKLLQHSLYQLLNSDMEDVWISVLTLFPAGVLAQCPSPGPSLLADFSPCLLRGPVDGCLIAFLVWIQDRTNSHWNVQSIKRQYERSLLTQLVLMSRHTLFFSSFCFCRSSKADRRFSALIRCSSSFLRRSSSCCSLSCRAFSSFSSHWVFLAAKVEQTTQLKSTILAKQHRTRGGGLFALSIRSTVRTHLL